MDYLHLDESFETRTRPSHYDTPWFNTARKVAKINNGQNYWSYVSGFDITQLRINGTFRSEKEFYLSAGVLE